MLTRWLEPVDARRSRRKFVATLVVGGLVLLSGCGGRVDDEAIIRAALGPERAMTQGSFGAGTDAAASGTAAVGGATDTGPVTPSAGSGALGSTTATSAGSDGKASGSAGEQVKTNGPAKGQPSASVAGPKSPIKIGNIGSYSGVVGALTVGARETLQVWASWINARGGLQGHPVNLVIGDNQADASTGLTLAKRMVESDKIIAFVGNLDIFGFQQINDYAAARNVPLIGGDGVDPGWYTSPNAFPITATVIVQLWKGLRTLVDKGVTKLGIMYCLEVAKICQYANDGILASPIGKYVVASDQVSIVAPSYTSQCLRLKQRGVEAVLLILDTNGATRFAQNCKTQGYTPQYVVSSLNANPDFPPVQVLEGTVVPTGVVPMVTTGIPAVAEYHQALGRYGPSTPRANVASLLWVSGQLLLAASEFLTENPSSEQLYKGLHSLKKVTLGGLTVPLTYAKGKPAANAECVFLQSTSGGKFVAPTGAKAVC